MEISDILNIKTSELTDLDVLVVQFSDVVFQVIIH